MTQPPPPAEHVMADIADGCRAIFVGIAAALVFGAGFLVGLAFAQ